jgi:hypothetical protein
LQIGIPMFFVYLLYRYRVPAIARYKKRCHQLRRVLDTVDRESHGQINELRLFLDAETSEDLTYEQLPAIVLEHVLSYLTVIADDAAGADGTSPPHGFIPSVRVGAATQRCD